MTTIYSQVGPIRHTKKNILYTLLGRHQALIYTRCLILQWYTEAHKVMNTGENKTYNITERNVVNRIWTLPIKRMHSERLYFVQDIYMYIIIRPIYTKVVLWLLSMTVLTIISSTLKCPYLKEGISQIHVSNKLYYNSYL